MLFRSHSSHTCSHKIIQRVNGLNSSGNHTHASSWLEFRHVYALQISFTSSEVPQNNIKLSNILHIITHYSSVNHGNIQICTFTSTHVTTSNCKNRIIHQTCNILKKYLYWNYLNDFGI